ncbi:MAG: hypothetical protein V4722_25810 [Bacteroidota bacterium]
MYISKKPAQWTTTFLFVAGLLALILLANGILQLFVFNASPDTTTTPGFILAGLGILFAALFWRVMKYRKKINSTPPEKLRSICIVDLSSNKLLDAEENILSSLDSVHLLRKMQLGSSSPALKLQWNNGSLTIANGNPFSGGISAIEKVLASKGINRK